MQWHLRQDDTVGTAEKPDEGTKMFQAMRKIKNSFQESIFNLKYFTNI